eukprot:scaffold37344_cov55-Phaeocystis_antarctica.AAC.2
MACSLWVACSTCIRGWAGARPAPYWSRGESTKCIVARLPSVRGLREDMDAAREVYGACAAHDQPECV